MRSSRLLLSFITGMAGCIPGHFVRVGDREIVAVEAPAGPAPVVDAGNRDPAREAQGLPRRDSLRPRPSERASERAEPIGDAVRTGPFFPAAAHCFATVYPPGQDPPRPYLVVGIVEARRARTALKLVPELEKEACSLGADSIMDLTFAASTVHGERDSSARATAIIVTNPDGS
jgi:hypothetical protein